MINTPADLEALYRGADAIENLGDAITRDIDRWMDDHADRRSDGEVAVDFLLDPTNIRLVTPVLRAAGWQPPAHAVTSPAVSP